MGQVALRRKVAVALRARDWQRWWMNRTILAFALAAPLAACATTPTTDAAAGPQDQFWAALESHCGKAYAGRMVSNEEPDAAMRGAAMAMHVRNCSDTRIEVPFHIQQADGTWDRSRTWVINRTDTGLRLKHDHRHEDGSHDATTMYGGDTAAPGTARAQEFPVDAESVAMFRREGLTASVTNVWRVDVDPAGTPGAAYSYRLMRDAPNARNFHVRFDLTRPIAPPPAPWGHD
jgi:hypothetical protein